MGYGEPKDLRIENLQRRAASFINTHHIVGSGACGHKSALIRAGVPEVAGTMKNVGVGQEHDLKRARKKARCGRNPEPHCESPKSCRAQKNRPRTFFIRASKRR